MDYKEIRTIRLVYCDKKKTDVDVEICFYTNCPYYKGIENGFLECHFEVKENNEV